MSSLLLTLALNLGATTTISGAASIDDTWLRAGYGNRGATTQLLIIEQSGTHYADSLVRIKTGSYPAGKITGFRMIAKCDAASRAVNAYIVSNANADWIEGVSSSGANVGESTWERKRFDTTNWAGSVGLKTATTDYIDTIVGTLAFTGGGAETKTMTIDPSIATSFRDVLNAGFLLRKDTGASYEATTLYSSDSGTTPLYFEIDYTPPSGAFRFGKIL